MFEPYTPYNLYSPYYNYNLQSQQSQQIPRQNPQIYKPQNNILQGKVVDSLEVVKATDIPYDGSVSYFPLTDNSAIITKQLQSDGTSKLVVYKPEVGNTENKTPRYITESELKEQIKDLNSKDIKDMKEDIKILKRKLEDITDEIKDKKEK